MIKITYNNLGYIGTIFIIWILWIAAWLFDITPIVPFSDAGDVILEAYYFITGVGGFWILVLVSVVVFFIGKKKGKKSVGEKIAKAFAQR